MQLLLAVILCLLLHNRKPVGRNIHDETCTLQETYHGTLETYAYGVFSGEFNGRFIAINHLLLGGQVTQHLLMRFVLEFRSVHRSIEA